MTGVPIGKDETVRVTRRAACLECRVWRRMAPDREIPTAACLSVPVTAVRALAAALTAEAGAAPTPAPARKAS